MKRTLEAQKNDSTFLASTPEARSKGGLLLNTPEMLPSASAAAQLSMHETNSELAGILEQRDTCI